MSDCVRNRERVFEVDSVAADTNERGHAVRRRSAAAAAAATSQTYLFCYCGIGCILFLRLKWWARNSGVKSIEYSASVFGENNGRSQFGRK